MKRLSRNTLLIALMLIAQAAAGGAMPLTFYPVEPPAPPLLKIESYEMKEVGNDELRIHLSPEDAKALQKLTAERLGQKLTIKQGERVLASPTIRAAITGQDFVVSLKK